MVLLEVAAEVRRGVDAHVSPARDRVRGQDSARSWSRSCGTASLPAGADVLERLSGVEEAGGVVEPYVEVGLTLGAADEGRAAAW